MNETRRDFLKKTGGCALGMVSLATQMHHLGSISAMAQKVIDSQQIGGDNYKALVCLFWAGGNDGNNMVIPNHNDSGVSNYSAYSTARNSQGLALTQTQLQDTQILVPRLNSLPYALHPNLGTAGGTTNAGIHELYGLKKIAIVANVGNLVRPMLKSQYQNGSVQKPYQLYSHSDQVTQQQTSISNTQGFTGWGGRISDKMTDPLNPGLIPMVTSISGAQMFTAGQSTLPLAIADSNTLLSGVLNPAGFGTNPTGSTLARLNAFNTLRAQDLSSNYVAAASHVTNLAMEANSALQVSQETTVPFPNTSIGRQLRQVARLIKKRTDLNVNRQVFYVQIGGFDTHSGQLAQHTNLFGQLSQAMRSFYDEMVDQGVSNDVTTFTLSDFGRTFNPAGSGTNVGSDHGWGNHMFVMGGAVDGGNIFGSKRPDGTGDYYPTLEIRGPDDTDSNTNARGRWIPTTSVDQYAVRMARWFGLAPADETAVFPNLVNFASHDAANSQLNFLP